MVKGNNYVCVYIYTFFKAEMFLLFLNSHPLLLRSAKCTCTLISDAQSVQCI